MRPGRGVTARRRLAGAAIRNGRAPTSSPPPAQGVTRQDVFSVLGGLGAILTLFTAVMFYFGWRRSDVQSRAMGIDVSLFGFSTQDYVLRSISSLYLPILALLFMGLAWVWLHLRVLRVLDSPDLASRGRPSTIAARASLSITVIGVALAASCLLFVVAAGMPRRPGVVAWLANQLAGKQWVVPLVLVAATLAALYAWWFHRQLRPSRVNVSSAWHKTLPAILVAGTIVLGGFWMLEEYAGAVGRGNALQVTASVDQLARTVVISPTPLGIDAPGVEEARIGDADSPSVRYRTTGLRLLARSGSKVLLVHDGWTPDTGTVVVLADSDDLGWQFSS